MPKPKKPLAARIREKYDKVPSKDRDKWSQKCIASLAARVEELEAENEVLQKRVDSWVSMVKTLNEERDRLIDKLR